MKSKISRRELLKIGAIGLGGLAISPGLGKARMLLDEFPKGELLGRNTTYLPNTQPIRLKPSADSGLVRYMNEDESIVWLREVVGQVPMGVVNSRWVETPEGYVYAPRLQPVRNITNEPVNELPIQTDSGSGMWAEVTVPYVNLTLTNPPARAPWMGTVSQSLWRLYYSQVVWIDQITTDSEGTTLYRVNERYGSYGDIFLADARAFRPLTEAELQPINPEITDKKIVVNINHQTLSCFEGNSEVYYCQVSTGRKLDAYGNPTDDWVTPVGEHFIYRKLISIHMAAGTVSEGWDTMAVPWTSLFVGLGAAIHSTHWHNDFGTPRSHGCVNASPEDAKWIFRWTTPMVNLQVGDQTDNSFTTTRINVVEQKY